MSAPGSVFAADLADKSKPDSKGHKADNEPSQRPYQTVSAVAAKLGLSIDTRFAKAKYKAMADAALACDGAVLISWQHQDIPHLARHILKHTGTPENWFPVPDTWPGGRYDLVWVFGRPAKLVVWIKHMAPIRSRFPLRRQEGAGGGWGPIVKRVGRPEGAGNTTRRAALRAPWRRCAALVMRQHHAAPRA